MNIEEADIAAAIRAASGRIGHVHFVDSNRRPAGRGHLDFPPIVAALRDIGYDGFASAEALPDPDPDAAARQTIEAFRRYFRTASA
jgi:sugar phosphate isomerase/epimerase